MPYGNYSYIIDSTFQPFSMQEMLVPFAMYKDEFEKSENAYNDLTNKSDEFKYLSETLPEGSKARKLYEGYANDLRAQAEDFAQNGLNMGNRRALTNLKRRYQGEIGRLSKADEALRQERELRRKLGAQDSSILYADDNLSIDSFLDNATPNLYSISGNDLYARGAAAGKAASARIYSAGDEGSTLNGYYRKWVERNGYSKESIDAFRANAAAIPELQQAADAILAERGVTENLTGNNLERARQSVLNGIIDGAVYQERINPVRDEGVMSAATRAQYALQREQMAKNAAMNGLTWNNQTHSWDYDINKDPSAQRAIKLQELKGEQKALIGGNTSDGSAKVNPQKFRELLINNGVTSNGTILTGTGENMDMIKLATNSTARYVPFYGDAFNNDASNGFDILDWENSGISGDKDELKPYKFSNLKSDKAKQQIRDYVQEMIPDVVEGLTQEQVDEVIGYMDFVRDYDRFSDNHFRLSIPGTNEEGKIVDKNKFNGFLSNVNKLRIRTLNEGFAVQQRLPAQIVGGNAAPSPLQVLPK